MPLYEYQCDCGKHAEAYNSVANRQRGPLCHGPMTKRVSRIVQVNAPTGAALRSNYQLFQEASAELPATSDLWARAKTKVNAMVAAGEAPSIPAA